jgi:hypothetical protein
MSDVLGGPGGRHHRANVRYAPFAAVVLFLLLLVVVAPSRPPVTDRLGGLTGAAGTGAGSSSGPTGLDGSDHPADVGVGPTPGGAPSGDAAPGTETAEGARLECPEGTGIHGLGSNGVACGFDAADEGIWPWSSPWLLDGDRSHCAPGGELQHAVTQFQAPPCVPRFTGDNGGATWDGVTGDEIVVVRYLPRYSDLERVVLESQGLYDTVEAEQRSQDAFTEFFDRHYDLYGRKVRWVLVQSSCVAADPVCYRNDAKAIVEQHSPFIVQAEAVVIGSVPAFFDELSRRGVINIGGWHLAADFNAQRRPYRWDSHASGDDVARLLAEYWCAKLVDRPAIHAGDPALRERTRRLGITVEDAPGSVESGQLLARLVSGELCASPQPPILVSHSGDSARAAQQASAIAVQLKDAGATTVVALDSGFTILMGPAMDQQRYFPEHLMAGTKGQDYDLVGRFNSPTQWRNAFGLSHRPMELPRRDADDWRVWRAVRGDAGPGPCAACPGTLEYEMQVMSQLLWAGPNLNPLTFERGSMEAPELNGYQSDRPWPGWQCCNPATVMWRLGNGSYTAHADVKEVWWDPDAVSPIDGSRGTYVCSHDCQRFSIGSVPPGDAVPNRPHR